MKSLLLLLIIFLTRFSFATPQQDPITQPQKIDDINLRHVDIIVDKAHNNGKGVRLHCVEAGTKSPSNDNVVLLLHGFPDFWYTWRNQIPFLVKSGYFVVTPDLRGFGMSDKPLGVDYYSEAVLSSDVEALRTHYLDDGNEQKWALVAGHDWGGAVVWAYARNFPDGAYRFAVIAMPHPVSLKRGLLSREQLIKSWYVFFFLVPGLSERFAGSSFARSYVLDELEEAETKGGSIFTTEDRLLYDSAVRFDGSPGSPLGLYRAFATGLWPDLFLDWMPPIVVSILKWMHGMDSSSPSASATFERSTIITKKPVMMIWAEYDKYLGMGIANPPEGSLPNIEGPHFLKASHWVQVEKPDIVNRLILDFINGDGGSSCVAGD